ncbi:hypothetical protein [Mucilaginibacter sp. L3T2-6]|uniref:hypothetical protein n=1 Tax=Mucilaginibacter sp. L3T2-6 TaxID=3062491 RepID=UPI002676D516|nr:hypothetical protein [Mucilaginibacter sp. L3T2-6]MDO3641384.1 hypothetical protein [Mucilaginibacter sp. L3T2-6]MDV6213855.1 hypothetical protein [Mucilaginibacter sp. L3T2-6]
MTIYEVLAQLEEANAPVIKTLHTHAAGETLALGFKSGMTLKGHRATVPARLLVIDGSVNYRQEGVSLTLAKYADLDIPVDVPHSVQALEDSLCLLLVAKSGF